MRRGRLEIAYVGETLEFSRHGNERRSAFAERRSVFGVLFGFVFLFGERCSVFGVRRSVFWLFGVRCFVRRRFLHVVVFGVQFEKDCALGVLFGVVFQYCVLFGVSFGIACFVHCCVWRRLLRSMASSILVSKACFVRRFVRQGMFCSALCSDMLNIWICDVCFVRACVSSLCFVRVRRSVNGVGNGVFFL